MILAIAIIVFLSIILPWQGKASATIVIVIGIVLIFVMDLLMTAGLTASFLPDGILHQDPEHTWIDLGLYPRDIIEDYSLYRFVTSMFVHGGFAHIGMNLLGLIFLGTQLEQRVGWKRFLMLYYGSGIVAGCVVLAVSPFDLMGHDLDTVGVGASGAIFGILGSFFYLYPRAEIVFPLILVRKWNISLITFIYLAITTLMLYISKDDNVSHLAHFAGLAVSFPLAAMVGRPPDEATLKKKVLDLEKLRSLADDSSKRRSLEMAEASKEDEVRDAWISDLARKANCPSCSGKGMIYQDEVLTCPRCDHRIKL